MKLLSYISILILSLSSCQAPGIDEPKSIQFNFCEVLLDNPFPSVGDGINIKVTCGPEINDTVHLMWSGTFGDRIYPVYLINGSGDLQIKGQDLIHSGVVTYQLNYMGQSCCSGSLVIKAGKPMGILETYVGPKTIIAGGQEEGMMVAIPLDTFGNVADTYELDFGLSTADENINEIIQLKHLTASKRYLSGDKTGKWYLGASVDQSNSLEEHIYIKPSAPMDFKIKIVLSTPYADGRTVSVVSTTVIEDSSNNIITDGTIVNFFLMSNDKMVALYQAPTIGGIARLFFEHPDRPMELEIQGQIANIARSNLVKVIFEPFIQGITAKYIEDIKAIHVGPLKGSLNQFLPDGYRVAFHIQGDQYDVWKYGMLENGSYHLSLSDILYSPGAYRINIYVGDHFQLLNIQWK
ncbi:MAG: hypothetical protein HKN68_18875 [Saprospiraceae bacterium]|nr:hypothetical protein [Saprospiraceae bacterium]